MNVRFFCDCGQQLAAREEHVGKRVRCSACDAILMVPGAETASGGEDFHGDDDNDGVIRFQCTTCGKPFQAKREHAGRRSKCTDCGTIVDIPGEPVGAFQETPRTQSAGLGAYGSGLSSAARTESDEEESAPPLRRIRRIKKTGGFPWKTVIIAGCVLALAGAAFLFWKIFANKISPDFDLVPRDAQIVATIRVADILKEEPARQFWQIARAKNGAELDAMEAQIGVGIEDIERITFVAVAIEKKQFYGIVQCSRSLDEDKIVALLREKAEMDEARYQKKRYWRAADGTSCYFPSEKTLVVGTEEGVHFCMDLQKPKSGPLDDALKTASQDKYHVVIGGSFRPGQMRQIAQLLENMKGGALQTATHELEKLKSIYLAFSVKTVMDLELGFTFTDRSSARRMKRDAERDLKDPDAMMAKFGEQNIDPQAAAVLRQVFDSMKVSQSGGTCALAMQLDLTPFLKLAEAEIGNFNPGDMFRNLDLPFGGMKKPGPQRRAVPDDPREERKNFDRK